MFGLIGYKNVTEDIQKYVKKIHENGFCNVRFHFEIALSKKQDVLPPRMRRKIRCFAYGKRSDVQRQQQDVNSRRTAEESRLHHTVTMSFFCTRRNANMRLA